MKKKNLLIITAIILFICGVGRMGYAEYNNSDWISAVQALILITACAILQQIIKTVKN